jgi:hypothetical protein
MKRIIIIIAIILASCNDYLDITPDDATTKTLEDIFADKTYAERYLATSYAYLPCETDFNDNDALNPFVGASDEMNITWTYTLSNKINTGSWNPRVVEEGGVAMWQRFWIPIRQLNVFLENIGSTPMDNAERDLWIGEAHFLRAFFHFLLLRNHGPIPIVDLSIAVDGDLISFERAPFDECVQFIVDDCDKAINSNIPIKYLNADNSVITSKYGRATKVAATALKSRVLLYAASDLFNGNPDYVDFANHDGTKLFSGKDETKWQKAADAAKACIDLAENSGQYGLYYSASSDPRNNYAEIFRVNWNKEVLYARNRGSDADDNWHHEMCLSPNGMGGWSGLCPTQEIVDAYQMADGSTPILGYNPDGSPIINSASGYKENGFSTIEGKYHPDNTSYMYVNREPRFYASINFSGQQWRWRRIEFYHTGRDGNSSGGPDYTSTGYLMRKTSDEGVDLPTRTGLTKETWIYFRLGEIYLNYAEALNEARGPVADVHKYVNLIRHRAGLPNLESSLTKEGMRERIRHERRIELAFETHRYFDCRRWKISEEVDNKNFYRLSINQGNSLTDQAFFRREFMEKRIFEKKHYLWPIPDSDIQKLKYLKQSPFW